MAAIMPHEELEDGARRGRFARTAGDLPCYPHTRARRRSEILCTTRPEPEREPQAVLSHSRARGKAYSARSAMLKASSVEAKKSKRHSVVYSHNVSTSTAGGLAHVARPRRPLNNVRWPSGEAREGVPLNHPLSLFSLRLRDGPWRYGVEQALRARLLKGVLARETQTSQVASWARTGGRR